MTMPDEYSKRRDRARKRGWLVAIVFGLLCAAALWGGIHAVPASFPQWERLAIVAYCLVFGGLALLSVVVMLFDD